MNSNRTKFLWLFSFSFLAFSCACSKPGGQTEVPAKPADVDNPVTDFNKKELLKVSEDDCVGPLERAPRKKELTIGGQKFLLDGYLLTQVSPVPEQEVVVGILSDSKENTEENRRNLQSILDFFRREKVEIIIHLGDVASIMPMPEEVEVPEKDEKGNILSEDEKRRIQRRVINKTRTEAMTKSLEDIVEVVSLLAESELPVLVIGGNRECKSTFNSAMAALSHDFPNVFNLNLIRRVDLIGLDIISLPGYFDSAYIHCPWNPCVNFESDTLPLLNLARESNDAILLVSHGPPRQNNRNGIDVVSEGANVGNPWMTNMIQKAGIMFGAFGNIQEAGGKATNLEGNLVIAQDTFVNSFYLNPGPADSVEWKMNDGTESVGMAAVVYFRGKEAKYKIFRIGEEKP